MPAAIREGGQLSFAGALVFEDQTGSLALKSRIDHSAGGKFSQAESWRGFSYYDNTVKRSWLIGDNLFTFSNKYLKISRLSDFSEIKTLILTPGDENANINPAPENTGVNQEEAEEKPLEQNSADIQSPDNTQAALNLPENNVSAENPGELPENSLDDPANTPVEDKSNE